MDLLIWEEKRHVFSCSMLNPVLFWNCSNKWVPKNLCPKNWFLSIALPADTDVFKTSSERLKKVTKQDDVTTSGKRRQVYDVLQTSDLPRLEDVQFTTSSGRLAYNVLKAPDLQRLQDVWFTTSLRRPIYVVLKTSNLRRLEKVWFMTSWRRQ